MRRAEWLAARYPNIRAARCLRDMDGECRDARGLPRLPEEKGRAPRTVHLVAVAESPHTDVAAADIAPETPVHAAQPELPNQHVELAQPQPPAPVPQQGEESIAPRFTLYEYEGIFGVLDSAGPQMFFVETRERAPEEVERASGFTGRVYRARTARWSRTPRTRRRWARWSAAGSGGMRSRVRPRRRNAKSAARGSR